MHAYTQTSNERCIKIKGTRKFNWCQCTTTSLSLLTKCSTRTSRSIFPDGFSFFTFLFPTLCHNRNESALQMLKIEVKKNGSEHTQKKRFQWHVFDYCFEYTFYFKLFGHWMPSAFSPLVTFSDENEHIFILNTRSNNNYNLFEMTRKPGILHLTFQSTYLHRMIHLMLCLQPHASYLKLMYIERWSLSIVKVWRKTNISTA